jgi:hypothetical protein
MAITVEKKILHALSHDCEPQAVDTSAAIQSLPYGVLQHSKGELVAQLILHWTCTIWKLA